MNACELRERAAVRVGNAALAPRIEPLWRVPEMRADDTEPDGVDQGVMCMEPLSHAPEYQRCVYISSGQSLIGRAAALMHKLSVASDPSFGERLRVLIGAAGYKNPRRFAIDGMGWPETAGPQRLTNYLKGRLPDIETGAKMAEALKINIGDLYGLDQANSENDEALLDILRNLMSLEGIPPETADTIARTSLVAQRLLQRLPDDDPLPTRVKYAARVAWTQRPNQATGT